MKNVQARICKAPQGHGDSTQFTLAAETGSQVFVAGTFNNWNPDANPLVHNPYSENFRTSLHIPSGSYEYKFVVNGVWISDPNCPDWVLNAFGSMNSVIRV